MVFLRSLSQGQLRRCPSSRDNTLLSCPQSDHDLRGDSATEYQQSCSKLAESGSIILTTHTCVCSILPTPTSLPARFITRCVMNSSARQAIRSAQCPRTMALRPARSTHPARLSGPHSRLRGLPVRVLDHGHPVVAEVARRISTADPRTETTYDVRTTSPCRAGHQHPRSLETYADSGIILIMPPSGLCPRRSQVDTSFGDSRGFVAGRAA